MSFQGPGTGLTGTATSLNIGGSAGSLSTTYTAGRILYGAGSGVPTTSSTFFYDSANGRLGIGTASPQTPLHVFSNVGIALSNNSTVVYTGSGTLGYGFGGGVGAGTQFQFRILSQTVNRDNGAGPNFDYGAQGDLVFQRKTNNLFGGGVNDQTYTEVMRIGGATGYVGIGTASPQSPLHIYQTSTGAGVSSLLIGDSPGYANNKTPLSIMLSTLGVGEPMSINMGRTATTSSTFIGYVYTGGGAADYFWIAGYGYAVGSGFNVRNDGRVGIGTTNPSYPLQVTGEAYTSGTVYVGTTSNDPTYYRFNGVNIRSDGRIFSRGSGHSFGIDSSSGTQIQFWTDNGGSRVACGSIASSGSTTYYYQSSDYRLKDNIAPITGALNIISSLNPVTYTWKSDGSPGHGFIAHELQEVVPDAVVGEKDAVDSEGNIKPQGIDKSYLVSYLTAAIQELSAENTTLKTQMSALEARLAALEGTMGSRAGA